MGWWGSLAARTRSRRSPRPWEPVGYDEIIVSTLPAHVSHWLPADLPARVRLSPAGDEACLSRLECGALRDLTGLVEGLGFKLELVPLVSASRLRRWASTSS